MNACEKMFSGRKDVYSVDKSGIVKAMCEHTSTVQEIFQICVRKWLQIVGSSVFGIKHYWVRYKFAPSRGQIHAHLLAICDNQNMLKAIHQSQHSLENWAKVAEH